MTEWWQCLSEFFLGAKSATSEIDFAPVETVIDHFNPTMEKEIWWKTTTIRILSAVLVMDLVPSLLAIKPFSDWAE